MYYKKDWKHINKIVKVLAEVCLIYIRKMVAYKLARSLSKFGK